MSKYKKKNLSKIIYNQEEMINKLRDFKNRLNYQPDDSFFNINDKSHVEDDISFCKIETNDFWEQVMKRVHPRNTIKRINYENNKIINSHNSDEREKLKIKLNNLKTQISTKESNIKTLKQKLTEFDKKNKLEDDNEFQNDFKINALNLLNDKIETRKKNVSVLKEKANILTKLYAVPTNNDYETNISDKLQHLKDRLDEFYSSQNTNHDSESDLLQKMKFSICRETLTELESVNPKLIIKYLNQLKDITEGDIANIVSQDSKLITFSPKLSSYWLYMKDDWSKITTLKSTFSKLNQNVEEKTREINTTIEQFINKQQVCSSKKQKLENYISVKKEIKKQNYLNAKIDKELIQYKENNLNEEILYSRNKIINFNNSTEIALKHYEMNSEEIRVISQQLQNQLTSVQSANELLSQELSHLGENLYEDQSVKLSWLNHFVRMPLYVSHVDADEIDLLDKLRCLIFENHLNDLSNRNFQSTNEQSISISFLLPPTPKSKSIIVPNSTLELNRLCKESVEKIQFLIEKQKQNLIIKTLPKDWLINGRSLKDYHEEYIMGLN